MRPILTALTAILLLLPHPALAQSVLRIGLNDDPDALDPTISRAYTGRLVFAALCDKLFDVTPDLKIVPQLATGHEWAADRKSIVIKLRPGVRFQDGEPFNAEAVKFNIERHQTTPGSFRKPEIGEIVSVDVVNDLTVRFNLSQPLVPLLAALTDRAGMMVSPKAAKALGDKLGTQPVCAGPYKFVQRVAQGKIVVERVADYWDKGAFSVDRIEFVPITDSTSRLASLRSGDLHMIERVSPTDLAEIRGDVKLKVTGIPELGYQVIPLNVANGPKSKTLADVRLRQALDLAIDRETLVKTVFGGEYIAGNQFISPANPYYDQKVPVGKRDVAKAKQLLKDAGQPNLTFTL
ncbi:MAG: ABC transporter substrate-binding protein, partial [Candidatus Rokuibacteriota bacterium]